MVSTGLSDGTEAGTHTLSAHVVDVCSSLCLVASDGTTIKLHSPTRSRTVVQWRRLSEVVCRIIHAQARAPLNLALEFRTVEQHGA